MHLFPHSRPETEFRCWLTPADFVAGSLAANATARYASRQPTAGNTRVWFGWVLSIGKIVNGVAFTLTVVEAAGSRRIWTDPEDLAEIRIPTGVNSPGAEPGRSDGLISSYHQGGANGSVRFLSKWKTVQRDINPCIKTPSSDNQI